MQNVNLEDSLRKMQQAGWTGEVQYVGYDPGFFENKIAIFNPISGLKAKGVLSVTGLGNSETLKAPHKLETGIQHLTSSKKGKMPDIVQYKNGTNNTGNVSYLVGKDVERFTTPDQQIGYAKFSSAPQLKAQFYASLASLIKNDTPNLVFLFVLLPVPLMLNEEQVSKIKDDLNWIVGEHNYTVNNKTHKTLVAGVHIITQPLGGLYSWAFNQKTGNPIPERIKQIKNATVGVADIGFYTADFYVLEDGKPSGRYSGGDSVGNKNAASALITLLEQEYNLQYDLQKADHLIAQNIAYQLHQHDKRRKTSPPTIWFNQNEYDISHLCTQAIDTAKSKLSTVLDAQWGKNGQNFSIIVCVGGGVKGVGTVIPEKYPINAYIPNDPQLANCQGGAIGAYSLRSSIWPNEIKIVEKFNESIKV